MVGAERKREVGVMGAERKREVGVMGAWREGKWVWWVLGGKGSGCGGC